MHRPPRRLVVALALAFLAAPVWATGSRRGTPCPPSLPAELAPLKLRLSLLVKLGANAELLTIPMPLMLKVIPVPLVVKS